MNALKIVARKVDVRLSHPKEFVRQRLADNAASLSRASQALARVELVNEALCKLTELLYERDAAHELCNVDRASGRLLIPAPWGSKGWRYYGLRYWEGRVLRALLWERQASWTKGVRPPLYSYTDAGNYWHLNLPDYGSLESAGWYLKRAPVTLKEWQQVAAGLQPGRQEG